jgi:hypothetical protein
VPFAQGPALADATRRLPNDVAFPVELQKELDRLYRRAFTTMGGKG